MLYKGEGLWSSLFLRSKAKGHSWGVLSCCCRFSGAPKQQLKASQAETEKFANMDHCACFDSSRRQSEELNLVNTSKTNYCPQFALSNNVVRLTFHILNGSQ